MLRFWDNEVLKNIEGVLEMIRSEVLSSPSSSLTKKDVSSPLMGED
ncbi:MAG: hypothetical protein K6357_05055 [Elusimicrobiota bacterium]